MELRLLRYFWTVADTGNVSKAAEQLHITQPTLSRQIKELETELGSPLFTREKNRLELTEAGLFLKSRAEEILDLTQATQQAFVDRRRQLFSGHIRIGCVEADNSDTMAMMLEEFIRDYPEVKFTVLTGTSDYITDHLDKGLVDMAILLEPINTDKYHTLTLPRTEKWGLLVSQDSFLAQKESITPDELGGVPLMMGARSEISTLLSSWTGSSVDNLNVIGYFNLHYNILPLVERQIAAALVIEGATIDSNVRKLKFLPLNPEVKTNCVLAWRKNRVLSPVVSELVKRFKQAFEEK
ncbi:Chromosome initiation inhibitor [Pediococcus damnosus]|uniref:Chromosome initiation inhibitor n=1 Tax=Pediococcus damnosus TaxID=51663 RepID=A0A0R2HL00_9LACO|nr:LysR family transcriptional regulator [Pediococcus damnosus]AMV63091.1 Chromosome initiation inhibitor [Pediococcus damnosus]AMV64754.1 Chromosome initiation inhibitor [Pediococcus damnosus]AMV67018.1 Chromosome initiation inhibitor [Pediococcus damnosus]AMV69382.1 Chromosome initiation inhibitor [Pediococcus damnosus]KJU73427.1 transcriptional regulator [Pediococcus damnosus LMG 28219]